MSELKVYRDPKEGTCWREFYEKSEADKVIAEKDKEIQRLENLCVSYRIDCDNLAIREANACKEIERYNKQLRHQKYKRSLAMARWCELHYNNAFETLMGVRDLGLTPSDETEFLVEFYRRWYNRWLAIADQFSDKEA